MIPEIFLWKFLLASRPSREAAEEFDASRMFVICFLACIIFAARWIFCCPLQGWSAALWIRTVDLLLRLLINTRHHPQHQSHECYSRSVLGSISISAPLTLAHSVTLLLSWCARHFNIYDPVHWLFSVTLYSHSLQRPGTCSAWDSA